MGYFGGIVLLLIVYFGFIQPDVGLFGVTGDDGLAVRVSMVHRRTLVRDLRASRAVRGSRDTGDGRRERERVGFLQSYASSAGDIARLWKTSRHTVLLPAGERGVPRRADRRLHLRRRARCGHLRLLRRRGDHLRDRGERRRRRLRRSSSAPSTTASGRSRVIVAALVGLVDLRARWCSCCTTAAQTIFWIFGLLLCLFVGPAQSASRTFLTRLIPRGSRGRGVRPLRDDRPCGDVPRTDGSSASS